MERFNPERIKELVAKIFKRTGVLAPPDWLGDDRDRSAGVLKG
jgi:hypothetical protein